MRILERYENYLIEQIELAFLFSGIWLPKFETRFYEYISMET